VVYGFNLIKQRGIPLLHCAKQMPSQDAEVTLKSTDCKPLRSSISQKPSQPPDIAVLVCTYNGGAYIQDQLDSIVDQSLKPSDILISDDGSTDETLNVVSRFQRTCSEAQVSLSCGPQQGYSANFFNLLAKCPTDVEFVALADQDDVWLRTKLERACNALEQHADRPALYGSATIVCDANLKAGYLSRTPSTELSFGHALAQNFAGGNMMVLNTAALTLVQQAIRRGITVPVYDWFLYQLISGAGGVILFDREPAVLYRQHHTNAIGAARGLRPRLWRLMQMARGRYRHWNDANLTALTQVKDLLSSAHQTDLQRVCKARSCHLVPRLRLLWRSRIRRFSIEGFLALWISITFNQF
jgi:glycosyltransferase involved in cell wall biosynthesis